MDMQLLQKTMTRFVSSDIFYDSFMKEVNKSTIKYTPYRSKANQIIEHEWSSDQEYHDQIKRYVPDDE